MQQEKNEDDTNRKVKKPFGQARGHIRKRLS
jgi:hypothetical protein